MDKASHSSEDSSFTNINPNSNRDQYLRHLNKISHRITKPLRRPTFDHTPPPPPPPHSLHAPPNNLQPPVYNINKSEFRDVVQKLTGSPAHERFSSPPPPIHPPKPQSSRLQRIRPPPLAGVTNRPAIAASVSGYPSRPAPSAPPPSGNFAPAFRQVMPPSPLPPFPSVHGAAESPISAYMRYLQSGDSDPKNFSRPPISPRWNACGQPPPPHNPPPQPGTALLQFPTMPSSPLPFGCLPSPRSPYPLLSPGLLFSPGFPQLPVSPRVPVTSPRWRDL